MSLRLVLRWLTTIVFSAAIVSTTYLYFYPVWFGCAFPSTTDSTYNGFKQTLARHAGHIPAANDTTVAPFRLLVLADPQLEGDSSLPDPEDALLARLNAHRSRLQSTPPSSLAHEMITVAKELILEDIPRSFQAARKTLDLFGNDYYLAHIYRTLHWWTIPTHVTVLGDLLGSQWVSDDEFSWRAWRYWNRVFAGSRRVSDEIMSTHDATQEKPKTFYSLQSDDQGDWRHMVINAVGNHDIGYAGDVSKSRIERFESAFGKVNWDIHFSYPFELIPLSYLQSSLPVPSFHLVILNSMLLDTPAFDDSLQSATYSYINNLITNRLDPVESRNSTFTLLLTHVPLHKPKRTCVDAPFFDYWDYTDADGAFKSGGLKEQNHLSEHASQTGILQSIFGMSGNHDATAGGKGRNGLILTGHDHAGCDVTHYVERDHTYNDNDHANDETNDNGPQKSRFNDLKSAKPWSWKSIRTTSYPPVLPPPPPQISNPDPDPDSDAGPTQIHEIVTSLREVTLRSMMGDYGGNAGLLSLWYDFDVQTWKYEIQMCPLGVQHVWWAVHVIDIVAVLILLDWVLVWVVEARRDGTRKVRVETQREKTKERTKTTVTVNGKTDSGAAGRQDTSRELTVPKSGSSLRSTSHRRRKG